ncbi:class I SAM-dependent methyltransferase [Candidatus Protochlamydia phocaeensis]|uniref:class I SAM-dependent methyltransferase n=1 Tax=Candidatus Protochlamydia phocaeensis TaxID=1414722 RepID=UPI00083989A4|nr:class I SAM-dependent methyltransferase [Candidatus Protochlamydia phocaeensis]
MRKKVLAYLLTAFAALSQGCYSQQENDCEKVFTDYWLNNTWGGISLSGAGSDLVQTATIREALPVLLQEYQCQTMADAPCGDFYWMRHVDLPLRQYIGVDVVKAMIDYNQSQFGNEFYSFIQLDLTRQSIPKVDLVLCRDCLVHLSYADIARAIKHFKQSGTTYLLTTSFTALPFNYDIPTGSWRPLNFMLAPFNFPQPLAIINENCTEGNGIFSDKSLVLWRLADLPDLPF